MGGVCSITLSALDLDEAGVKLCQIIFIFFMHSTMEGSKQHIFVSICWCLLVSCCLLFRAVFRSLDTNDVVESLHQLEGMNPGCT